MNGSRDRGARGYAYLFGLVAFGGFSASAQATVVWPNTSGSGPCQTTLQACIDSVAPAETVVIGNIDTMPLSTSITIDEDILIAKSLSLIGAQGVDATFASGRSLHVSSPVSGAVTVNLDHLAFRHGHVFVDHQSDTASTYNLSRIEVIETDATTASGRCAIYMDDIGTGAPHFIVGDSSVRARVGFSAAAGGICIEGFGGAWDVDVFRNHVSSAGRALNRLIIVGGMDGGPVSVTNNIVDGNDYNSGISVSANPGSPANTMDVLDNSVVGANVAASAEYALSVVMTNTTARIANNSVVGNRSGLGVQRFGADSSSARVANNLVAFNLSNGLSIADSVAAVVTNGFNLVYGNGFDHFVPGPGTVTSDPLIVNHANPRFYNLASPAVDHGNNADVPGGFGFDADGESRIEAGTVDIGAFEFVFDQSGQHRSAPTNTAGDYTQLDESNFALAASANVFVTPLNAPTASAETANTLGVFQDNSAPAAWSLFHENLSAMSVGRRFSVYAPLDGRSHFLHTTTSGNVVNQYTMLDHPELNGQRSAVAFVTHNWNPGGVGGTYHDHRIGLEYFGTHWYIRNEDGTDMPSGVSFNVVIAPLLTLNSFTRYVGTTAQSQIELDHPLLDDNACAAPQVTRADNPFTATVVNNDVPFALDYRAGIAGAPGHWYLYALGGGGAAFPANAGFNVMVFGAQSNACRDDRIFADGLDG